MHTQRNSLRFLRTSIDISILVFCYMVSLLLTTDFERRYFLFVSLISIWIISAKSTGLYNEFRSGGFRRELSVVFKNILTQSVSAVMLLFFVKEDYFPRLFIIYYTISLLISISVEKYIFRSLFKYFRRNGRNINSILIVGAGKLGMSFYETIKTNPHFGYRLTGFLDDEKKPYLNGQYLGPLNRLNDILSEKTVDDVIITLPNQATKQIEEVVRTCEKHTTRVKIIPDYFNLLSENSGISMFGSFPMISVMTDRLNELHWVIIKRTLDILLTLILFITVFSWLFPVLAILIKLDSSGPVFYRQERWTKKNRKFIAYKFRSMRMNCCNTDENGRFLQATQNDPRITRIGRILRKTNLDELPQFINVLKGDMSLVGPRPHPTLLNLQSKEIIDRYMLRHLVKPGITGWAQVNGYRGETKDPMLMQKRIDHDIWYIENWSIWLDIQILFLTIWRMIKGDPYAY